MRVKIAHENTTKTEVVNRGLWVKALVRERTIYRVTSDVTISNAERYVLNSSDLWDVVVHKYLPDMGIVQYPKEMTEAQFIEENSVECTVRRIIDGYVISEMDFETMSEARMWEKKLRDEIFGGIRNLILNNWPHTGGVTFRI